MTWIRQNIGFWRIIHLFDFKTFLFYLFPGYDPVIAALNALSWTDTTDRHNMDRNIRQNRVPVLHSRLASINFQLLACVPLLRQRPEVPTSPIEWRSVLYPPCLENIRGKCTVNIELVLKGINTPAEQEVLNSHCIILLPFFILCIPWVIHSNVHRNPPGVETEDAYRIKLLPRNTTKLSPISIQSRRCFACPVEKNPGTIGTILVKLFFSVFGIFCPDLIKCRQIVWWICPVISDLSGTT